VLFRSLAKTGKKNDAVKTQCENGRCINKNGVNRDSASKDKDFAGTDLYNIEYQTEVFKKLSGLLRDPVTPVIAPPVVMRVLILPYKGDENELYLNRYVLLLVDQPKWVMGDYLFNSEGAGR
jgi:conjugal transfer pilus assembly protein TraV